MDAVSFSMLNQESVVLRNDGARIEVVKHAIHSAQARAFCAKQPLHAALVDCGFVCDRRCMPALRASM